MKHFYLFLVFFTVVNFNLQGQCDNSNVTGFLGSIDSLNCGSLDLNPPSPGDNFWLIRDLGTENVVFTIPTDGDDWSSDGNFGQYSIRLLLEDETLCADSVTFVVNQIPSINDIDNIQECDGIAIPEIQFTGTPGAAYEWTNSNTSIGLNETNGVGDIPSFEPNFVNGSNTSTIEVTPILEGCEGVPQSFTITVNPTPDALSQLNITGEDTYCEGDPFDVGIFNPPSGTTSIKWINPDGEIDNGPPNGDATVSDDDDGNWQAIAVITTNNLDCESDPLIVDFTVNEIPNFQLSNIQGLTTNGALTVCEGEDLGIFADPIPGTSIQWFDDGILRFEEYNISNEDALPPYAGTWSAVVTDTITGCETNQLGAVFQVVVPEKPTMNNIVPIEGSVTDVCLNSPLPFLADPAGTFTYQWVAPLGDTLTGNDINDDAIADYDDEQGNWTVIKTNSASGCSDSFEFALNVDPLPAFDYPDIIGILDGETPRYLCNGVDTLGIKISDDFTEDEFDVVWSRPGTITSLTDFDISNISSNSNTDNGPWTVTIIDEGTQCERPLGFTIQINPVPDFSINDIGGLTSEDEAFRCVDDPVAIGLSNAPSNTSNPDYSWEIDGEEAYDSQSILTSASTDDNGIWTLTVTDVRVNTQCFRTSDPFEVTVYENPVFDSSLIEGFSDSENNELRLCEGSSAPLSVNNPDGWQIDWTNGSENFNDENSIDFNEFDYPDGNGEWTVEVFETNGTGITEKVCSKGDTFNVIIDDDWTFIASNVTSIERCYGSSSAFDFLEAVTVTGLDASSSIDVYTFTLEDTDGEQQTPVLVNDEFNSSDTENSIFEGANLLLTIKGENGFCEQTFESSIISIYSNPEIASVLDGNGTAIGEYCEGEGIEFDVTMAEGITDGSEPDVEFDMTYNDLSYTSTVINFESGLGYNSADFIDGNDGNLPPTTFVSGALETIEFDVHYIYSIETTCSSTTDTDNDQFQIDVTESYTPTIVLDSLGMDGFFCQEELIPFIDTSMVRIGGGSFEYTYPLNSLIDGDVNRFEIFFEGNPDPALVSDYNTFGQQIASQGGFIEGLYEIKYSLFHEHCDQDVDAAANGIILTDTDSFEVKVRSPAIDFTSGFATDTCVDNGPIDLTNLVSELTDYTYLSSPFFLEDPNGDFGTISNGTSFVITPSSVNEVQNVVINYDDDWTVEDQNVSIIDEFGCLVPDEGDFELTLVAQPITTLIDVIPNDTLYYCAVEDDTKIGFMNTSEQGPFYDYTWYLSDTSEVNEIDDVIVPELFPSQNIQLTPGFTYPFYLVTRRRSSINSDAPLVCTNVDTITVIINNSPIIANSDSFVLSPYCSGDSTFLEISDWSSATGFDVDSVLVDYFIDAPQFNEEGELLSPPSVSEGYEWLLDAQGNFGIEDTLAPSDFLSGGVDLPNVIHYAIGFELDEIHNCPTYSPTADAIGPFDYIGTFETSQPSPEILSAANFEVCPGGSITLSVVTQPGATNTWDISNGLDFSENPTDSTGIDVSIPIDFSASGFEVDLVQTQGLCDGSDEEEVVVNPEGSSPNPKEYFKDSVSNFLIYNDSTVCYQWGYIEIQEGVSVFIEFEGEVFQSLNLTNNPEIPPVILSEDERIICKVSNRDPISGECDPDCFTIAPKNFTETNPIPPKETSGDLISLYPNPNNGQFQVALNDLIPNRKYSLEVYNYLGQPIWKDTFISEREDYIRPIVMPNVANGMYGLRMLIEDRPIARLSFILNR